MSIEQVLVVPTRRFRELGPFQGLCRRVDDYLPHLLDPAHLLWLPRPAAECDPEHKQIIPYVVLRFQGHLFHYRRGQAGGEQRLRKLRSVGVGGHINPVDEVPGSDPYRRGLLRELDEEIELRGGYRETILGLINDDATPVGQVHLGIVHLLDLETAAVRGRDAGWVESGFAPLRELAGRAEEFETWSRFVLETLTPLDPAGDAGPS